MRIIFLSTPEFGIASLEKLIESPKHEVVAVVTQCDKPSGRGNHLKQSAIKEFALSKGLRVLTYEKISRDGLEDLRNLKPDIMITCAYGQILSQAIIDIPKYGIINVHASLLPKYRGASPIQTCIIKGESETGITIMQTEAGLDTGDILSRATTKIGEEETAGELSERLSHLGAELLLSTLDDIECGETQPEKQQHANATITTKINKEDCYINFNKSAKQVKCLILGANPDPIATTRLGKDLVKIYRARVAYDLPDSGKEVGEIIEPSSAKRGVFVQCGTGVLEIVEAQFAGGKVLPAKQLFGGRKFAIGMKFEPVLFPEI